MNGNSSDESVEDEEIVIEEMNIGMITETDHRQKGWKIFYEETEEHEDVPSDIWAAERLRQRMRMRIYAVR